jgi:hypothetical protein
MGYYRGVVRSRGLLASVAFIFCVCAYKHLVSAMDLVLDHEVTAGWVPDEVWGFRNRSLEVSSE